MVVFCVLGKGSAEGNAREAKRSLSAHKDCSTSSAVVNGNNVPLLLFKEDAVAAGEVDALNAAKEIDEADARVTEL